MDAVCFEIHVRRKDEQRQTSRRPRDGRFAFQIYAQTRVGHPAVLESDGSCGSLDRQTIGCCERKSLRNPRPAKERHRIGSFQDTERLHGQLAYDPAPLRRAHAGGLALKNSVLTRAVEAWHGGVQNGNSLRCKALLGPRVTASPGPAPGHIDRLASAAMDLGNFGNARHQRW